MSNRFEFEFQEDVKMIKWYLKKKHKFDPFGLGLWKHYVKNCDSYHTVHSLSCRFRRSVVPYLNRYRKSLSKEEFQELLGDFKKRIKHSEVKRNISSNNSRIWEENSSREINDDFTTIDIQDKNGKNNLSGDEDNVNMDHTIEDQCPSTAPLDEFRDIEDCESDWKSVLNEATSKVLKIILLYEKGSNEDISEDDMKKLYAEECIQDFLDKVFDPKYIDGDIKITVIPVKEKNVPQHARLSAFQRFTVESTEKRKNISNLVSLFFMNFESIFARRMKDERVYIDATDILMESIKQICKKV